MFELCSYAPDISFYGEHLAAFNIITQYVQRRMPFALKIFHWLRTSENPLYREVQDCRPWLSFIATLLRHFTTRQESYLKYLVLPRQNSARRTASPRNANVQVAHGAVQSIASQHLAGFVPNRLRCCPGDSSQEPQKICLEATTETNTWHKNAWEIQ